MMDIDWKNCCADDGFTGERKRIIIAGDWVPAWDAKTVTPYAELLKRDPVEGYGDVLPVLEKADLRVVNLECTLAPDGCTPAMKGGPHLFADEEHLSALQAGGFEIVTLANNHTMDFGAEGLERTRNILDRMGIKYFGAGMDDGEAWRPLILDLDGIRVGMVCFTEGHDLSAAAPGKPGTAGWEVERVCASIRELRKNCDVVIVIPHAGIEFTAHPAKYCIDAYRRIAAERPDAIVAHHPHVPQGIEVHDGVPIFYSLGNFLFHMGTPLLHRRHGYLVELEVSKTGVHGFTLHPYHVGDEGLEILNGWERMDFGTLLEQVSRPFEPGEDPYSGFYAALREHWSTGFPAKHFGMVMKALEDDPVRAAVLLRNRLTVPQHLGLYLPMCERVINGSIDDVEPWAAEIEHEYMRRLL